MTAQKIEAPDLVADQGEALNEVRLVGRLAADPVRRELRSGGVLWTLQVSVARPAETDRDHGRPRKRADQLECAVWDPKVQRQVAKRHEGDLVEVRGALRRRFFQAAGSTASRVDVEVSGFRVVRRAGSG